jgi:binding-protein-dependent transport system inner membrane component/extracellular solute-binding protein
MRHKSILTILIAALFLSLAGVAQAQDTPKEITYMMWGSPEELAVWQKIVDEFQVANPQIKVNVDVSDWESYWSKLRTLFAGGTPPDVFAMDAPLYPDWQSRGVLLNLQPYIDATPAFLGGAFGTFLLRQYFLTIPIDLAEAARVDGASLLQIFWRIYLPLSKPALAALSIFIFLGSWNNLLGPLIYLPTDLHQTTLPVGLALFQQQYGGKWTVMMAGALVSIAPIILVFFFAQRYFIEGIALSGIKR